jgi:hypothetical protein
VLIKPSLGVPNWSVIYIINTAPSCMFHVAAGVDTAPSKTSSGAVAKLS